MHLEIARSAKFCNEHKKAPYGAPFLILKFQIVSPAGVYLTTHDRTPDNRGVKTTIKRKIPANNRIKLTHIQGVLNPDVELSEGAAFFADLTVEHGESRASLCVTDMR